MQEGHRKVEDNNIIKEEKEGQEVVRLLPLSSSLEVTASEQSY
jgi:hypothetical protein